MGKRVEVEEQAEQDIRAAVEWYEAQKVGLGEALLEALESLRRDLVAAVAAPGSTPEEPVWRMLLKRFPYSIVFLEEAGARRVIAIAHFKRRPGYWSR